MASFIRNHPKVEATSAGTTISTTLSAAVPAGRTLLATLAMGASTGWGVSGLSKPGGESATWTKVGEVEAINSGGTAWSGLELWAIKTTTGWANGQTVTATWSGSTSGRIIGLAEFDGVSTDVVSTGTDGDNETTSTPDITVSTSTAMRAGDLVVQGNIVQFATLTETATGGTAAGTRQSLVAGTADSRNVLSTAYLITGAGSRSVTYTGAFRAKAALIVGLRADDYPPDTPVLTTNASGGTVDRGRTIRLGWVFSSPNAVDSQSAYALRIRLVGASSWATYTGSIAAFREFAGGDLAAGDYEWQVKLTGAQGKESGWSDSGFFTAADSPAGPTITYPVDGQPVEPVELVVWSTPTQDAYQLRRVGDDGGFADPGEVYFDTGIVNEPATRSLSVAFETNNRAEHVQVRVLYDDLWSDWDDVTVDVAYTPPPTPTFELYPDTDTGTLNVLIVNPDPTGDDPAAAYNDVYVNDGAGFERRATGVSTSGSWRYWTPISGRDYATSIHVLAVSSTGTTASSEEG